MEPEHYALAKIREDGLIEMNCTCGASWTHAANTKAEEMQEIMKAHKAYFNKPATLVL